MGHTSNDEYGFDERRELRESNIMKKNNNQCPGFYYEICAFECRAFACNFDATHMHRKATGPIDLFVRDRPKG